MASVNFADVKISTPDGTFRSLSVVLNGMDISKHINALSIDLTADEPLVFLELTLLAKVEMSGQVLVEKKPYAPTLEEASENYDAAINEFMNAYEEAD